MNSAHIYAGVMKGFSRKGGCKRLETLFTEESEIALGAKQRGILQRKLGITIHEPCHTTFAGTGRTERQPTPVYQPSKRQDGSRMRIRLVVERDKIISGERVLDHDVCMTCQRSRRPPEQRKSTKSILAGTLQDRRGKIRQHGPMARGNGPSLLGNNSCLSEMGGSMTSRIDT